MSILFRPEFQAGPPHWRTSRRVCCRRVQGCPQCGVVNEATKLGGKFTRLGVYERRPYRRTFTVMMDTIFEASHVPINLWLQATYLTCSSRKGIGFNQLHLSLEVALKTVWFMSPRIHKATRSGPLVGFGASGSAWSRQRRHSSSPRAGRRVVAMPTSTRLCSSWIAPQAAPRP